MFFLNKLFIGHSMRVNDFDELGTFKIKRDLLSYIFTIISVPTYLQIVTNVNAPKKCLPFNLG